MKSDFRYAAHWRDSARRPRFFFLDARIALLLLLFILHIRFWTLILCILGGVTLGILEYFGLTVEVFCRYLRNQLAGSRKIAIPWWLQ